jgi:hypothetical protein
VIGAVVGSVLLWLVLQVLDVGEVLGTTAQLAAVVGVAAVCDVLRVTENSTESVTESATGNPEGARQ